MGRWGWIAAVLLLAGCGGGQEKASEFWYIAQFTLTAPNEARAGETIPVAVSGSSALTGAKVTVTFPVAWKVPTGTYVVENSVPWGATWQVAIPAGCPPGNYTVNAMLLLKRDGGGTKGAESATVKILAL